MNFEPLLQDATAVVVSNCFQLPIDGQDDPVYRKKVYSYELYHQLKVIWPYNCEYELGGEADKHGYPLVGGNGLDRVKPDLLIHRPGSMNGWKSRP